MSATPVLDAHRARLIARLADALLGRRVGSMLDVGCGAGDLLALLGAGGAEARGVDASAARVAAARARGLDVDRGEALALDPPDGAFDRVVIRHTLHHLADPARAVREAWRVARKEVVLAEPWADPACAEQGATARFEGLTSAWIERGGGIHGPPLDAEALAALLPAGTELEVRTWREPTRVPPDEVRALAARAAGAAELDAADRAALAPHVEAAERGELAYLGSVAVLARKR